MLLNLRLHIQILSYKISNIIHSYWAYFATKDKTLIKSRKKVCKSECNAKIACPECGCILVAKAALKENECPLDKW